MSITQYLLGLLFLCCIKGTVKLEVCALSGEPLVVQILNMDANLVNLCLNGQFDTSERLPHDHAVSREVRSLFTDNVNPDDYELMGPIVSDDQNVISIQAIRVPYEVCVIDDVCGNAFSFIVSAKGFREIYDLTKQDLPLIRILSDYIASPDKIELLLHPDDKVLYSHKKERILAMHLDGYLPPIPDGIEGIEPYMSITEAKDSLRIRYAFNDLDKHESDLIIIKDDPVLAEFLELIRTGRTRADDLSLPLIRQWVQKRRIFEDALEKVPQDVKVTRWDLTKERIEWDGGKLFINHRGFRILPQLPYFYEGMPLRELMREWWYHQGELVRPYWEPALR